MPAAGKPSLCDGRADAEMSAGDLARYTSTTVRRTRFACRPTSCSGPTWPTWTATPKTEGARSRSSMGRRLWCEPQPRQIPRSKPWPHGSPSAPGKGFGQGRSRSSCALDAELERGRRAVSIAGLAHHVLDELVDTDTDEVWLSAVAPACEASTERRAALAREGSSAATSRVVRYQRAQESSRPRRSSSLVLKAPAAGCIRV